MQQCNSNPNPNASGVRLNDRDRWLYMSLTMKVYTDEKVHIPVYHQSSPTLIYMDTSKSMASKSKSEI